MKTRKLLSLVLLLGLGLPAAAQPPARDYSADVPLMEDTAAARDTALQDALAQVMARVAGQPVPDAPLEEARRWVQHFGVARGETDELLLRAAFDPGSIDTALRSRGYPVWGAFAGDRQQWRLAVDGLTRPQQLAELLQALQQPGHDGLQVDGIEGGELLLRVTTASGMIMLDQTLAAAGATRRFDSQGGILRYRIR
ncbi:DUF2066 domain-containing protein [Flagellatimonas centrodinii]|uniref:DUF2066 domain-containing protein n=1 Tax=Flagellatimonas centrodinii TaxID=2806210 RepID=UPI001FED745B|nr:DUF2066 domain-containing protein [Flagellatimonas centrodinii]ULQ45595.1 DUF2066 domain-containing protein [Flagellatimonas centrodinii]